jgi:hypothetical protein
MPLLLHCYSLLSHYYSLLVITTCGTNKYIAITAYYNIKIQLQHITAKYYIFITAKYYIMTMNEY